MDFALDDNAERLQARVGTFLRESHPGRALKDPEDRRQWEKAWARLLADRGFAGPASPKEWGGMELSLTEQVAYHEEMTRARVPRQTGGLGIVAPTILKFGSAEQRRRYLPLIAERVLGLAHDPSMPAQASYRTMSNGPLVGLKVVDMTANMTMPYATMILAEQGADVTKSEPPRGGK